MCSMIWFLDIIGNLVSHIWYVKEIHKNVTPVHILENCNNNKEEVALSTGK